MYIIISQEDYYNSDYYKSSGKESPYTPNESPTVKIISLGVNSSVLIPYILSCISLKISTGMFELLVC